MNKITNKLINELYKHLESIPRNLDFKLEGRMEDIDNAKGKSKLVEGPKCGHGDGTT